jgi:hypothetical protein
MSPLALVRMHLSQLVVKGDPADRYSEARVAQYWLDYLDDNYRRKDGSVFSRRETCFMNDEEKLLFLMDKLLSYSNEYVGD